MAPRSLPCLWLPAAAALVCSLPLLAVRASSEASEDSCEGLRDQLAETLETLEIVENVLNQFRSAAPAIAMDDDIPAPEPLHPALKSVVGANAAFAGKLYSQLVNSAGDEDNLVSSAFSAHSVLAMLKLGAAGDTADQMDKALALPEEKILLQGYHYLLQGLNASSKDFTLETANGLFVQQDYNLLKDFVDKASKYFSARTESLDFAKSEEAAREINVWVERATHNKIKDLVPEDVLHAMTKLVLVNAIYFKAKWAMQFEKKRTRKATFQRLNGEAQTDVDFMFLGEQKFVVHRDNNLNCQVLRMPYQGKRLSMYLFLSTAAEGFKAMEAKLGDFDYAGMKNTAPTKLDVVMPRFKLRTMHDLNEPLASLGMEDMFSYKADFSRLSGHKDLKVDLVMQKAFVEVNEEGTEAAAATVAVMERRMDLAKEVLRLDRPFAFAIRDDHTGLVLFQGRVMNPAKE